MAFFRNRGKGTTLVSMVIAVILVGIATCTIYVEDYYHTDMDAVEAFSPASIVEMKIADNGNIIWEPRHTIAGFIFYPGGKVEYTAYIPLMEKLAAENILCVLVEMPFNLAVFDIDAADGIQAEYPQIETWYIGGHSLGGSMAASYVSENTGTFDGLILLGAYSAADLSQTELDILSVYGSEDRVLNREKYRQNRKNLPADFEELIIEGGCHAYFGMYGAQEGDGTPTITNEEQINITAEAVSVAVNQLDFK